MFVVFFLFERDFPTKQQSCLLIREKEKERERVNLVYLFENLTNNN